MSAQWPIHGVFSLWLLAQTVLSARLLLTPPDHGSHVRWFTMTGKHLKEAGHDVYLLSIHKYKSSIEKEGIGHVLLEPKWSKSILQLGIMKKEKDNPSILPIGALRAFSEAILNQTIEMLQSEDIMKRLIELKFDLVIVDGMHLVRGLMLIPYKLNVPFVSLSAFNDPWATRVPSLPSLETFHGFGPQPTKESSFFDRFVNVLMTLGFNIMKGVLISLNNDASIVSKYVPERPPLTLQEIWMQSEMWLVNLDIICLDWPRVSAPHYQFVAGTGMEPAEPLSDDMENLVNKTRDGIIVITFGSGIKEINLTIFKRMLAAFAEFPHLEFIMRYDGELPETVPGNVHLRKWLSQNDLLGHPKTKLFITHSGNNGQLEALYHGVPMLNFALMGDQEYNADRIVAHKFGRKLNLFEFNTAELVSTIEELLSNPVYSDNIKRCSAITKDLPSGASQLVMSVEHVLKFGGAHIKPPGLHMPMYQVLMLDVLAVMLIVVCAVAGLLYTCCRCCCRVCCPRKQKTD